MKKLIQTTVLIVLLLALAPYQISAKDGKKTENKTESAEAKVMIDRLLVIKEMDKTELTRTEKKALKSEVKGLNSGLASINNGVYLTTGGIIIIILLLILIL